MIAAVVKWLRSVDGYDSAHQEFEVELVLADAPRNEPKPDAVVVTGEYSGQSGPPIPSQIRLLAEIDPAGDASTSLYARFAIPEYWVLDVTARRMVVHREPVDGPVVRSSNLAKTSASKRLAPQTAKFSSATCSPSHRFRHTVVMPVAIEPLDRIVPLPHKLWTRDEFEDLGRSGLIDAERYELLEGELVPKVSKNMPHVKVCKLLAKWLLAVFGDDYIAGEVPIDLRPEEYPSSAPEPDAYVLNKELYGLPARPRPEDLVFVAEVAVTTLEYDLTGKARLYARSRIPEYWVLDVIGRCIHVHREPVDGRYSLILRYGLDERLATLAAPDRDVLVRDLFEKP